MRSQPEKLQAIVVMAFAIGIIALGLGFAIVSPRSPGGAAATEPTFAVASRTPSPPPPVPTDLPYAIEGAWDLDFAASNLHRPTLSLTEIGIGSGLVFDRGTVKYWSGYAGGCDDRIGTFQTNGLALVIHLGENRLSFGCNEGAIDEVVARLARVVSVSLAPCPAGYRLPSSLPAPTDGSCRQLWLFDGTPQPLLVYSSPS